MGATGGGVATGGAGGTCPTIRTLHLQEPSGKQTVTRLGSVSWPQGVGSTWPWSSARILPAADTRSHAAASTFLLLVEPQEPPGAYEAWVGSIAEGHAVLPNRKARLVCEPGLDPSASDVCAFRLIGDGVDAVVELVSVSPATAAAAGVSVT